jgi:hypothetical protein
VTLGWAAALGAPGADGDAGRADRAAAEIFVLDRTV